MKKKYILLSLLFLSLNTFAQFPTIEWQKCFGGTDYEEANRIKKTSDGGYILVGFTESNNGDVTGNHGLYDFWIVKLSSLGVIEWNKVYGGTGEDAAQDVIQTADGGYIVSGYNHSSNGNVVGNHGGADLWLLKLSNLGVIEWQKSYGGPDNDVGGQMIQTTDGGYLLTAESNSSSGDVTTHYGATDAWVVKADSTGVIQWQKSYGGNDDEYFSNAKQTTDGGYILVGTTRSTNNDITLNNGGNDVWIVKVNNTGTIEWKKTFGGSANDFAYDILQTPDGGYMAVGSTSSSDSGDVTGFHTYGDGWLLKLDNSGALLWQKTYGGFGVEKFYTIQRTPAGNYLLLGYAGSYGSGPVTTLSGCDYWFVRVSDAGDFQWQKTYGGIGTADIARCFDQTPGGFILAGDTMTSNNGDVTYSHGGYDMWVVKLGPDLASEDFEKTEVTLYPNPSQNMLNIICDQIINQGVIYDLSGKSIKIIIQNNTVDVSKLQAGTYFIELQDENKNTICKKFIKQ